jgi:hypothetical protein
MPIKLPYLELKARLTELGYRLHLPEDKYTRTSKLVILCNGCDMPHNVTMFDLTNIEPGTKRCSKCGVDKRAKSKRDNVLAFTNIKNYFTSIGYTFNNDRDEFIRMWNEKLIDRKNHVDLSYTCPAGHTRTIEYGSFQNKKTTLRKTKAEFCVGCAQSGIKSDVRQKRLDEINRLFQMHGHQLIHLETDNKSITFVCGKCQRDGTSNFMTFSRPGYTGCCVHCANNGNRKAFDELRVEIEAMGLDLLMEPDTYTDNKHITIGCTKCIDCRWENISLSDAKRRIVSHFHCVNCELGCQGFGVQFKPYCQRCYGIEHPDADIPRRFRQKEALFVQEVKNFLEEEKIENQTISFNKELKACSKRRPDVFIDCLTHCVVGELDENQHVGYPCETKRVCELWEDVAFRPIVFIRLNPDSYRDACNTLIPSCFSYSKEGSMLVWDSEWKKRMGEFNRLLEGHVKNVPSKSITVEQIFYTQRNGDVEEPDDTTVVQDWSEGRRTKVNSKKVNQYRILKDNNGTFVEVRLSKGFVFHCEVEHIELLNSRIWTLKIAVKKNNTYYYVRCRETADYREGFFHKVAYSEIKNPTHKDKNGLNNRKHNIVDV